MVIKETSKDTRSPRYGEFVVQKQLVKITDDGKIFDASGNRKKKK